MAKQRIPWYKRFFHEDYPKVYRDRLSEQATTREVAFVERALRLKEGDRVLDLACGQGRHAVALAQRGMSVTAQDLTEDYLHTAQAAAESAGAAIQTVHSDMRDVPFTNEFNAVINMFTAFGYLESEVEDMKVLRAIANALKPGGRLLMDLLNREWVVSNYIRKEWRIDGDGNTILEDRELDLVTGRNRVSFTIVTPEGTRRDLPGHDIRLYTLTELGKMLDEVGLQVSATYGDFDGSPYAIETQRMIVVGEKPA